MRWEKGIPFWDNVRDNVTDLLLWLLQKANPYKDRFLSREMHRIADLYDTRPTGEWIIKK